MRSAYRHLCNLSWRDFVPHLKVVVHNFIRGLLDMLLPTGTIKCWRQLPVANHPQQRYSKLLAHTLTRTSTLPFHYSAKQQVKFFWDFVQQNATIPVRGVFAKGVAIATSDQNHSRLSFAQCTMNKPLRNVDNVVRYECIYSTDIWFLAVWQESLYMLLKVVFNVRLIVNVVSLIYFYSRLKSVSLEKCPIKLDVLPLLVPRTSSCLLSLCAFEWTHASALFDQIVMSQVKRACWASIIASPALFY